MGVHPVIQLSEVVPVQTSPEGDHLHGSGYTRKASIGGLSKAKTFPSIYMLILILNDAAVLPFRGRLARCPLFRWFL